MIVILSGTNRPGSNTRRVAGTLEQMLTDHGSAVRLLDLQELPPSLLDPGAYASKPEAFAPFQKAILDADGILVVTPEYNGSFPGVLKLFIDMLRFPESLVERPVAFVGLASGRWGALRSVEQLELIFQYRQAHIYGRRCFIPAVNTVIDADGRLVDQELEQRLRSLAVGFAGFCEALRELAPGG